MNGRFRIRTQDGEELEPRTLEIFSELVRSGVIRPQDQIFDVLTGEWVPAEAHPMVHLLRDPLVLDPLARSLDARLVEEDRGQSVDADSEGGLPLDLVEATEPSPEEAAEAFIRQMEEERQADPAVPLDGLEMELKADGFDGPPADTTGGWKTGEGDETLVFEARAGDIPAPMVESEWWPEDRRSAQAGSAPRRGWMPWMALAGVVALVGVVSVARAGGGGADGVEGLARAEVSARPSTGLATPEMDVRRAAHEAFLRAVDGERVTSGLAEVPGVWLDGTYLAGAAEHDDVRRYWEEARAYAEDIRSREMELYRGAYLEAAESAGLSGPVRSLRLARALEDFAAEAPARADAYAGMAELADAALALHEVLVDLGDRVTYEPIRGRRVSADPVLEAAGADPEAQSLLELALDRVLRALHGADGSPVEDRSQVSAWLTEALRRI